MRPLPWARPAYRWLLHAFLGALLVQFFLAGAGAFGATDYDPHRGLGMALEAFALVLLLLSLAGRFLVAWSAALFVLMAIQVALANSGADATPWLGALHGANALVIALLGFLLLRRAGPARATA